MSKFGGSLIVFLVAQVSSIQTSAIETLYETKKLLTNVQEANRIAGDIAMDGPVAVVPAQLGVYVFRLMPQGWEQTQFIAAPEDILGFGRAVAMQNGVLVISAYREGGTVFVYRFNGISFVGEQELQPSGLLLGFGYSVATSGDLIAVGSLHGAEPEGVRIFRWGGTTWYEEQVVESDDANSSSAFGTAVAIYEDVLVVGAPRDDQLGLASGAIYVLRWNGLMWSLEQKLNATDGGSSDYLGHSVAIHETLLVAGAPGDQEFGYEAGAGYAFRWNGANWQQEGKLAFFDKNGGAQLGFSAAIDGEVVLLGAWRQTTYVYGDGAAHLFRYEDGQWLHRRMLAASDPAVLQGFGDAVAIDQGTAIVIAPDYDYDTIAEDNAGVYLYRLVACQPGYYGQSCEECPGGAKSPCNSNGQCDDDINGTGFCHCDTGFVGETCGACAPGYFGPACEVCPGGAESPCSGDGTCDDGIDGSGVCTCSVGYAGVACDDCALGYFGQQCQPCPVGDGEVCSGNGVCDDGRAGTGACDCNAGFAGPNCSFQTIPAASTWGLLVLALSILIGAKLTRQPVSPAS